MKTKLKLSYETAFGLNPIFLDPSVGYDNLYLTKRVGGDFSHHSLPQKSYKYWRRYADQVFKRFPRVELVEAVLSGNKTESKILKRGEKCPPEYYYVVIASTGGKWGKSRRDYPPKLKD